MRAVEFCGLMTLVHQSRPVDYDIRRHQFERLLTTLLLDSEVPIVRRVDNNQPAIAQVGNMIVRAEVRLLSGNVSEDYFTTVTILVVFDSDDDDLISRVVTDLPLGEQFPHTSWRFKDLPGHVNAA